MAKADKETEAEESAEAGRTPAKAGSGKGMLVAVLLAVVLSAGASTGVSFFMTRHLVEASLHKDDPEKKEEKHEQEPKAPALYVPLDPAFVVNLEDAVGNSRFMQVTVQLMTRDIKGPDLVKASEPRIRNDILMLFSQQSSQDLATLEGKEKLRAAVLAAVQRILTEESGKPEVEGVYFTSFVIQ